MSNGAATGSTGRTKKPKRDKSISGESTESCESFRADDAIAEKIRMRNGVLVAVVLPILLGVLSTAVIIWYPHLTTDLNPEVQPQTKATSEASSVKHEPKKADSDWRKELANKGSQFRILNDMDIKYSKDKPLHLVIAGHVFDVSAGGKMYQSGSGYHGFIGQDGTRAFVFGNFDKEGLIPSLEGLSPEDCKGISGWINFYLNHEKYKFVGILNGWYFDENGKPTANLEDLIANVKIAEDNEQVQLKIEEQFPTCNVEWTANTGSRVWCSAASGGVQRSWVGVPRLFNEGNEKGSRCACVKPQDLEDSRVSEYEGCPKDSTECRIKENK